MVAFVHTLPRKISSKLTERRNSGVKGRASGISFSTLNRFLLTINPADKCVFKISDKGQHNGLRYGVFVGDFRW